MKGLIFIVLILIVGYYVQKFEDKNFYFGDEEL